jgi:hypothetical protein
VVFKLLWYLENISLKVHIRMLNEVCHYFIWFLRHASLVMWAVVCSGTYRYFFFAALALMHEQGAHAHFAAPCWTSMSSTVRVRRHVVFIYFHFQHVEFCVSIKSYQLWCLQLVGTCLCGDRMCCNSAYVYAGQTPKSLLMQRLVARDTILSV